MRTHVETPTIIDRRGGADARRSLALRVALLVVFRSLSSFTSLVVIPPIQRILGASCPAIPVDDGRLHARPDHRGRLGSIVERKRMLLVGVGRLTIRFSDIYQLA